MNASAQARTTDIGGRRLAWQSVGHGRALLLVNGYAASAADWDPEALSTLARSFEVICPDNRGIGDSELGNPDEPLTIDGMAEDLETLLDALEIEAAPVVGWSMGGFIAQRLAVRAPQRVSALALLSTDPGGPASALADPEVWAELIDHSGTPREQATRLISLLFPPDVAPGINEQFGDIVAAARAQLSPATLRAQETAMAAWHVEDQPHPGSSLPVFIAHGSEDLVIPPENADALAARWPDCKVERFAAGGHAFMAQEPKRLAGLITSFLQA
jgi:pimeloyl-ACP methyl ester carboxylesterase